MQEPSASSHASLTIIIAVSGSVTTNPIADLSLLSAIGTATNMGTVVGSSLQTSSVSSMPVEGLRTAIDSSGNAITTDLHLTPSPDAIHTDGTSPSSTRNGKSANEIAGVAAGTIGAIAAVLLLVTAWLWWRRRQQRERETTLLFAPDLQSPAMHEKDDYPRSIASVSDVRYKLNMRPGTPLIEPFVCAETSSRF